MSTMSDTVHVINHIKQNYGKYIKNKCYDVMGLLEICCIYIESEKILKKVKLRELSYNDLQMSSPNFTNMKKRKRSNNIKNVINNDEFEKRHKLLIKILLCCFVLDIEIFNIDNDIAVLKNTHHLIKTIHKKKEQKFNELIELASSYKKKPHIKVSEDYYELTSELHESIRICDRLLYILNELTKNMIIKPVDSISMLIIPYFYNEHKKDCIEVFGP